MSVSDTESHEEPVRTWTPSVRGKIVGIFLLTAVVMAGVLLAILQANREIDEITQRMVDYDVAAVKVIEELRIALLEQESALSRYLLTGEARWLERHEEQKLALRDSLRRLRSLSTSDTGRSLLDELDRSLPRYEEQVQRILADFEADGLDADVVNLLRRENNSTPEIAALCQRLLSIHNETLERNQREADRMAGRYRSLGYLTVVMIGVATLTLGFLLRTIVLQPIRSLAEGAKAYGAGHLEHRVPVQGNDELGNLSRTFNQMAAALQRERGRLTEISITDELTQLKNFRHFATRLEEEVRRAERYGHRMSLVLIDIDHFKEYNDAHGHPAGNEVLRVIGRLLRDNARGTDILARFGGEEFAAILPETDKRDASGLAEKIRRLIEIHSFPGEEYQPGGRLTVSIGVASVPEDTVESPLLLDAADRALYAAKHQGRNRVIPFHTGLSHPVRTRRRAV
jgi:diguanylate cyclase (GGDEF)-like protein